MSNMERKVIPFNQRPESNGLYDKNYEHDACGMGFIAHMDGKPSRAIVDDGLIILERLVHRGGTGAEEDTGDGAGILMAMPDSSCVQYVWKKQILLCLLWVSML